MFSKNLKYYRLKNNYTKKALADMVGVSSMAISNYESGKRYPEMEYIKRLAEVLNVKVSDFLVSRNINLKFEHQEFRKNNQLNKSQQEYIRESTEEYFSRFFDTIELLGGDVLTKAPDMNKLPLNADDEVNGYELREYLGIGRSGPVGNIVEIIENNGILLYMFNSEIDTFFGMNGTVNGRPYIVVNKNMTPERIRTTIGHELAHFAFSWPEDIGDKELEKRTTAISGAFLFPEADAVRELGYRRSSITRDMTITCREYGIALSLLVLRARQCGIISEDLYRSFFVSLAKGRGRKKEISYIEPEESTLFEQLVYRAVNEEGVSIQKGAELLKTSYKEVAENCRKAEAYV